MFPEIAAPTDARPKNFGPMRDASAHAVRTGPCGDTVEVWLRIDAGKIRQGRFMTDGCGWSQHCCSTAVRLAEGMRPEEAARMAQEQVLQVTGPVPEDHRHCALLAVDTIRMAIENGPPLSAGKRLLQWMRKTLKIRRREPADA